MHWEAGIGPGVWAFDTGLIGVWGPRSERSKTAIVVRFEKNRGEIFGSLEPHSGFRERVMDVESYGLKERWSRLKRTNKSAAGFLPMIPSVCADCCRTSV